jgi:hypothetical protein
MDEEKECFFCNKEVLLAMFGVALGVLFIAMGLDTMRRMRLSTVDAIEGEVVIDD